MIDVPALSLRWRVAIAFGLVSSAVTGLLAVATWTLVSGYMLEQREESATQQASINVRLIEQSLRAGSIGLEDLLSGFVDDQASTSMLSREDGWLTSGRQVELDDLSPELLALAHDGAPARQRLVIGGIPVVAMAFPVGDLGSLYIELIAPLELDRTFRFLSALLVVGTVLSGLLGVALGWWAGRRALRPLTELTAAAARVARGDLQARLPERRDPDLVPLAATFNATVESLEQRVRRDARFAGDVSHELRSPLTTMVNAVEVLRHRRDDLPPPSRQAVDLLASDVSRFQRMVIDLLEISRVDEAVDVRSLETVDLVELVRNVTAGRPGCPPIEADDPGPFVLADRRSLDRVVTNLLDNADRHGGGPVRLAVSRHDARARLEVDDAGPGVPAELRERIFDRFARGAAGGARDDESGSGLGLALVAQHVARHGGSVWVQDRPGGGARFVVELTELVP
ncbi:sensor histidine kinase [Pseudonocardia sp. H11422]|uniref:HAMP domain-containing sensor histidine kinase n=1 Tax=Pseudonocardia sp. H11422 TaxID=2835866 RepID=UPI001BDC7AD6|nr:HAMP domain-containing sensor histidine kinase [Pseudonocardia sp. H11422]